MILKSLCVTLCFAINFLTNSLPDEKVITGKASFYANKFEGRRTSSGQPYRAKEHTAAHRFHPFGTLLEITNKANGLKTIVRVNDRGPHSKSRLIDLSYAAAKDLGIINTGTGDVIVRVVLEGKYSDSQLFDEDSFIEQKPETISTFPTFPNFEEKEKKYVKVIKNADGSVKVQYEEGSKK
ncbi:MAG: septal ring lytic transglycosylase RlpA family protein [Arcicella sp.]|nr:septal ring lytic transglycosylase RlpA family protein [Arcicella sp.]